MKYASPIIIIAFIFTILSCNKNKNNHKLSLEKEGRQIENFDQFNKRFHSDSVFQISRVDFPIEGTHVSGFEHYDWTKKNWEFQIVPVSEQNKIDEYQHSLIKSDTLIIEKFWIENSGFQVERKFKIIDGKWFLIYYNDISL
ncbi:hypothetical protein [Flavobacterium reichenbachii]|uniref:DUF4348 domain-containing protein n=1 Tax=Flavobacterium reichenbachii TaxID=362418 RepID=A0A085ZLY8_9FLAO|nr:hypothetical protein [Flavobacterium reichenbachii]KFF05452.1 hypothetical protein IW19_07950 [Flavobacterium reichenbachii]OXB17792.1 hypothetical protein B0A68_02290 [Flavobacterium reichenbachii]